MGVFERMTAYRADTGFVSKYSTENVGVVPTSETSESSGVSGVVSDNVEKGVSDFFDIKTPLGYLMNSLHNLGYKVVDRFYIAKSNVTDIKRENLVTVDEYNDFDDAKKTEYVEVYWLTEFADVLLANDDVLTISCAGSGKTSVLIFKIIKDIVTGEVLKQVTIPSGQTINVVDSIFVGTFLRSGADELRDRLAEWQQKLGYLVTASNIHFGTLHAEFKRVLNEMGVATPIGEAKKLHDYVLHVIKSLNIQRIDGSPMTYEDHSAIEGILAYYRNRLDSERYNHPACSEYNITPTILDKLYSLYQYYKQLDGVMDFEDLQELLYKYLYITPNENIQNFVANRYRYIYLDEFQDTSQIQYAILKYYTRGRMTINKRSIADLESTEQEMRLSWGGLYTGVEGRGKVVAIGDDDQAIYSWRGSDVTIITDKFIKDYNPNVMTLSVNYRCPDSILRPVIPSISLNSCRYAKTLRAANKGGFFEAREFANLSMMASYMLDKIDADMRDGRSVAIICRTNFDGMLPALMLEDSGRYKFSISSEAMTLSSPFARTARDIAKLLTERSSKTVETVLTQLVQYHERYKVKELMNAIRNDESSNIKTSIWTIPDTDIKYSLPSIANLIKTLKGYLFEADGSRALGGDILALKFLYVYFNKEVYNKNSAYCNKMTAYLGVLINMLENNKYDSVAEFLMEMEYINERLRARIRVDKVRIRIVTVHEFKGKEADSVYVWNDSENVFPTSKTDLSVQAQREEERRVHYIACTRARQRCNIYALPKHGFFYNELDTSAGNKGSIIGVLEKSFKENNSASSLVDGSKVIPSLADSPIEAELPDL